MIVDVAMRVCAAYMALPTLKIDFPVDDKSRKATVRSIFGRVTALIFAGLG